MVRPARPSLSETRTPPNGAGRWSRGVTFYLPPMVATHKQEIATTGQGDAHDVTPSVARAVSDAGMRAGIVTVSVMGSTAGMTTIEIEPDAVEDLNAVFETLAPRRRVPAPLALGRRQRVEPRPSRVDRPPRSPSRSQVGNCCWGPGSRSSCSSSTRVLGSARLLFRTSANDREKAWAVRVQNQRSK